MGNLQSLPRLCWEEILSSLDVNDIQNVMEAHPEIHRLLLGNKWIWKRRAKQLFKIDPTMFSEFRRPLYDTPGVIMNQVCRADARLTVALDNIARDLYREV